jgi:4,5-dihydroxyphthalate decarboxylase
VAKTITFACWDYDRVMPVMDGTVPVEGYEVCPILLKPADLFPRTLQRQEFDVSELSFSSYMLQTSRGTSDYIAIPVFTSRAYRHSSIYVRNDAGINDPKDLEGKKVGIPEYQMTLVVWARGMLQDEYGVDIKKMKLRRGATNYAGLKERLKLELPDDIDIEPIPEDKSTNDLLLSGEIDAIISPTPPDSFVDGHENVRELLGGIRETEKAFHTRTGAFPIMHTVVIKKSIVEENPDLAPKLFSALCKGRNIALANLKEISNGPANRLSIPWLQAELAETRRVMGDNYWWYGIERNRKELENMCRYSQEQYLSERLLTVEELFTESTLNLPDEF